MKLTVIGGGGVRTPLLVKAVISRAQQIGLQELCLMDINAQKLEIMAALCREVGRTFESDIQITATTDPHTALKNARYVITTVRVGDDAGRILDERIALKHGVLGQETTGPGGFAMALRSIPVILDYAEMLEKLSPGAWIFNFTNPAGLVAQALRDKGFEHTIGICDSANNAQNAVASWLNIPTKRLRSLVFGLNHLSWSSKVELDGEDVLIPLLNDEDFLSNTLQRIFEPSLVRHIGMYLNEYLYYFYYREKALVKIKSAKKTRGEEVFEWNQEMFRCLEEIDILHKPQKALQVYQTFNQHRVDTYMQFEREGTLPKNNTLRGKKNPAAELDGEGYAGVALSIIEAFETGEPIYTALNVPNEIAIPDMCPKDVVEVSCMVDKDGIHTLPVGDIPEHQELLMRTVKLYERMTIEAVFTHSRELAVDALINHPLVLSYSLASGLVDDYLSAHAAYVGDWQ